MSKKFRLGSGDNIFYEKYQKRFGKMTHFQICSLVLELSCVDIGLKI